MTLFTQINLFFPGMLSESEQRIVQRSEVFGFAKRIRAMSNNRLSIGSADVSGNETKCLMVTSEGLPAITLGVDYPNDRDYRRYHIWSHLNADYSGQVHHVSSKTMAYALRRISTDRDRRDSFENACSVGGNSWLESHIREASKRYLNGLLERNDVDLRINFNFYNSTQEWLLRAVTGLSHRADFPAAVETEIANALKKYESRMKFIKNIQETVATMFGREKWLVCHVPYGYFVTAFDANPLVRYISDAIISSKGLDHTSIPENTIGFTTPFKFYKTLKDVPATMYDSLMSSLTLQRATREARYSDITGIDSDRFFSKTNRFLMSNEGGWINFGDLAYGRFMRWAIVDKD